MIPLTQVLRVLRDHARPELRRHGVPPACCIGATAVVLDVLAATGHGGSALPVRALAANAALRKRLEREGRAPLDRNEMERWWDEDGAWMVGLGFRREHAPGEWPGHLAAVCPAVTGKLVLIDLTLDQADRPDRGIVLPAVAALIDESFPRGDSWLMVPAGECLVRYERLPASPTRDAYTQARDWRDRSRRQEIVSALLSRLPAGPRLYVESEGEHGPHRPHVSHAGVAAPVHV